MEGRIYLRRDRQFSQYSDQATGLTAVELTARFWPGRRLSSTESRPVLGPNQLPIQGTPGPKRLNTMLTPHFHIFCFLFDATAPIGPSASSSFTRFIHHTKWRTTVGRTPHDEWSAHRRDLDLTTHNTHDRKTSMPLVGFEPTNSASVLFVVLCSFFLLLFIVLVTVHCSCHIVHCSCYYSFATLTEVFPCFFLSCKANARV
jgi:hypothetical protein